MNKYRTSVEDTLECRNIIDGLYELENVSKDFFYDETNNYRKFHIKSGQLNVIDYGEFLLGGVFVNNGNSIDISVLKKDIRLDITANELKFKHVASGSLHDILKSRKVETILKFLDSENINIHFQRVDSFYFGIVDIIDSVIPIDLISRHMEIKDLLYNIFVYDIGNNVSILHRYKYPDIESSNIKAFYKDIYGIVSSYSSNSYFYHDLLRVLDIGSKSHEAVFIQDNPTKKLLLVDDYSGFYRDRLMTFPCSNHYLDMEENVKKSLDSIGLSFRGAPLNNFSFLESHYSDGIQLSDVVIGLMSKIINYCNNKTSSDLIAIRKNLGCRERNIIDLIAKLIQRSDTESHAYFHNIVPICNLSRYGNLLF